MNILSLDTSSNRLSIAISKDTTVLAYKNVKAARLLESSLIPKIEKTFSTAKIAFKDIDGYCIGLGPGSFTSLRVGLSTLKAFVLANPKPVVGISSLDAMAMNIKKDNYVYTVNDARRQMIYGCSYKIVDQAIKRLSDYQLIDIKTFLSSCKNKGVFIGSGVDLYKDDIKNSKKAIELIGDEQKCRIDARCLNKLALKRFKEKKFDKVETLLPLYLYKDDCQVHRK